MLFPFVSNTPLNLYQLLINVVIMLYIIYNPKNSNFRVPSPLPNFKVLILSPLT